MLALLDEVEDVDDGSTQSAKSAKIEPDPPSTPDESVHVRADSPEDVHAEQYVGRPTPYALLTDGGGAQVYLLELGRRGPTVLLLVSPSCGSCLEVLGRAPAWQERLRGVPVHYVVDHPRAVDSLRERGIAYDRILFDESSAVPAMMSVGTPTLFAIGPGDHLLAGPVSGLADITETMEAIIAEVATARPDPA